MVIFSKKRSFLQKYLEAPRGCDRFTSEFDTDNLMWGDDTPKYSVTCGMDDDRFLSFDQIVAEQDIVHPISTNIRQNGGANSCKIACNPGTIAQYPGKNFNPKFLNSKIYNVINNIIQIKLDLCQID